MVTESSTSSERMIERELMVTGEAVALEVIPGNSRQPHNVGDHRLHHLLAGAVCCPSSR